MLTTLRRIAARTGSALALLALTVGVPAGLLDYVGSPLPDQMPTIDQVRQVFTRPVTDHLLIGSMATIVWMLWLLLAISVLVEAAAAISGVTAPRPRLLRPTQGIAAALVVGLTAGILAPAVVAPLSPAVSGTPTASAAVVTVATNDSHDGPRSMTVAYTAPQTKTVSQVTLVINGCGYTHKVIKNESLWKIADICLGDPHRWTEIWHLNKDHYWPTVSGHTRLTSPSLIFPGWVLRLPDDAVAPPGSQPAGPTTPTAPTPPPATSTTAPTAPPSAAVTRPASPTAVSSAAAIRTPTATSTASVSPAPAPTNTTEHDDQDRGVHVGIAVPGGWLTAGLGAALLLAVATVWKRRRHRYIPTPITSDLDDEPDLAPPLAARTRIRQTLRRSSPSHLDQHSDGGPTVREYATAEAKPPLPDVGPTGSELAGTGTLPVTAGLGLDGPGAQDAARALLVATLSSGHTRDPDAQGHAVVPASTLATLIGVSAVDLGSMGRLHVTATFVDAMAHIEEEIIRRSRVLSEAQAADVASLRSDVTFAEPLPQLLLIADAPEPAWHARLVTAIGLGTKAEIGAALIGAWPHGTTLTVAVDGTTTGGHGQRLAVMDTDSAAEAIVMLREAHADHEPVTQTRTRTAAMPTQHAAIAPVNPIEGAQAPQPADASAATDIGADPDALEPVHVRVLGEPAVLDRKGVPVPKLRAKSLELLVYLAVHRGGAPLGQIMEAIWPDATMRRASERLSTCVANLRGVLRSVARPDTDTESNPNTDATATVGVESDADMDTAPKIEPVINSGGHYRLDPTIVTIDWWTVRDEYAHIANAPDDEQRLRYLRAAISEIHGPLAGSIDYEWIETDREEVRRRQIKLYAQAAALLTDHDPHEARVLLDTACGIDPLSEELARRAMRAAAALGDIDGVRHRLDTLRRDLDGADIDIGADTEQLATTLLADMARPCDDDQ